MLPATIWQSFELQNQQARVNELIDLNAQLVDFGLRLTPADAEDLLVERRKVLQQTGRIEFGIDVTKSLLTRLAESALINPEDYVQTAAELYEAFHQIKLVTDDRMPDDEVIDAIMTCFEKTCGGSTELLMGQGIDHILMNYEHGLDLADISKSQDDWDDEVEYWFNQI